jgi:hypothetical protein
VTRVWTTPADVTARVRRRWDDGSLLRAVAAGADFPGLDVPLRGPLPREIGDDLAAVQRWAGALESAARDGRHFDLEYIEIGGRHYGRNRVPARAVLTRFEQAWHLLGVRTDVDRFRAVLECVDQVPAVRDWVAAHPHDALLIQDWPRMLAAHAWLDGARGSGRHLREITAPGVDTKFVERHRAVLARWLGIEPGPGLAAGLGLYTAAPTVRLRFGPGVLGLPAALTEGTFRVAELARLPVEPATAVVVENEATYLTVPVPERGIVVWGKGFEVDRLGALPWLRPVDIHYWGDLDTHGFAILDRLRAWLPQARSFLMDRQTLLAHRDRWVREPTPTAATLTRLQPAEAELYEDLVADRLGESVRLEQERVDWAWVRERLPYR